MFRTQEANEEKKDQRCLLCSSLNVQTSGSSVDYKQSLNPKHAKQLHIPDAYGTRGLLLFMAQDLLPTGPLTLYNSIVRHPLHQISSSEKTLLRAARSAARSAGAGGSGGGGVLGALDGVQHEGGHKDEHHLGVDLDHVLPEQEDAAAQLARNADDVLGVQLSLPRGPPDRDHRQVQATWLHRRQQVHLRAAGGPLRGLINLASTPGRRDAQSALSTSAAHLLTGKQE